MISQHGRLSMLRKDWAQVCRRSAIVAMTVATVMISSAVMVATAAFVAVITLIARIVAKIGSTFFAVVAIVLAMPFPVARRIFTVVPVISHEINLFATGAIFMTVLAPMLGVTGRDAEIKRRTAVGHTFDHYWLWVDEGRGGKTADIESPVEAGLADIDRDADIGGLGRRAGGGDGKGGGEQ